MYVANLYAKFVIHKQYISGRTRSPTCGWEKKGWGGAQKSVVEDKPLLLFDALLRFGSVVKLLPVKSSDVETLTQ